jgi:hypothetical protein
MKQIIALLIGVMMVGCGDNPLVIVTVISTHDCNWNDKLSNMILERQDTKERFRYPVVKGKVGDSFSIRERELTNY